ncbi:MAG: DUF349 domain-containing protein, partial [Pseudomonadota bacterium]
AWARIKAPADEEASETLQARYRAVHDSLRDALARQKREGAEAAGALDALLERLDEALDAGVLKDAMSHYDKARSGLAKAALPDGRRATVDKRLQAAAARIAELKRWRHWSTDKAREALIEQATALIDRKGKIRALADDVRKLRDAWKKLDHDDGPARRELWKRFDATCEKAYAPCKAHFDAQAAQRAANLDTRRALCEQLTALANDTDWTAPDWRGVVKQQREAQRAFNAAAPVDRKEKKPSERAFQAANTALDAQLAGERERELVRRRGLIRKVEGLSAEQDLRKAIAAAQDAQKQWSPTVQAERKVEKALWAEFRAGCDAVFERRRETFKAKKQEANAAEKDRRELVERVVALTAELDALDGSGASIDVALNQLAGRFDAATDAWQPAGRGQRSRTEPRFREACRTFRKRLDARRRQGHQREREALVQRAALCDRLERAALSGTAPPDDELASLTAQWVEQPAGRGAVAKALVGRYETALAACRGDAGALKALTEALAANLETRRRLCMEMEIAADIDSPPEVAQARMQHRIAQLSSALSSGGADGQGAARSLRELADAWLATGPVATAEHEALQSRFRRAMEAGGEPVD